MEYGLFSLCWSYTGLNCCTSDASGTVVIATVFKEDTAADALLFLRAFSLASARIEICSKMSSSEKCTSWYTIILYNEGL